jgi:hypothetical protein
LVALQVALADLASSRDAWRVLHEDCVLGLLDYSGIFLQGVHAMCQNWSLGELPAVVTSISLQQCSA